MRRLLISIAVATTGVWVAVAAASPAAPTAGTAVMTGLDNPRGLTFARAGGGDDDDDHEGRGRGWALYVAEAGKGGGSGNCITLPRGEVACPGSTGAVSRLWRGVQQRLISGLPSYAAPDGSDATGPHDVSFSGSRTGYVAIGLGGNPADASLRATLGERLGWTLRFRHDGNWAFDTDVAAFEATANPDGGELDSNPYALLEGAGQRYVVDAGANALFRLGGTLTVATFPSRAQGRDTDAVPTSVARGPDGRLYVGELTGAPFAAQAASIYRIRSGAAEVYAAGFTTVIDIDFDRRGNLYVLEHSSGPVFFGGTGTLWRVARDGARTAVVEGLTRPTSVAIGPDGAAYISNRGTSAGVGEVLRFEIAAPPGDDDDGDDD